MSFAKNRPQNRLQCTFTANMQKTVTLMIYAEGELFAKTDISAAKNHAVSKVCGEVYAFCLYFIQKMCYNYFEIQTHKDSPIQKGR